MKCPYCNYVSFEHLETCRKCSKDLTAHKSQYGIDFLEPVSLGVLAAVGGGAAAVADVAEEVTATFDTGDFSFEAETSEGVVIGEEAGEEVETAAEPSGEAEEGFQLDLGEDMEETGVSEESTDEGLDLALGESDEISLSDVETEEGIEIAMGEEEEAPQAIAEEPAAAQEEPLAAMEEKEEEVSFGEEPITDIEELASDSGFSLNLGEDLDTDTDISLSEPPPLPDVEEAEEEEISLDSMDLGEVEEATDEIEIAPEVVEAPGIEMEEEPEEISIEDLGGQEELEISMDEEAGEEAEEERKEDSGEITFDETDLEGDIDIDLSMDIEEEEAASPDTTVKLGDEEGEEEDFSDIELSNDEQELFAKEGGEDDEEIDLGDLDLQIGDEDLDIDFDEKR